MLPLNSAYGYAAAALIGFSAAWYVQGWRWDSDVQKRDLAAAEAISVNVDAVNQQLIASRAQTEEIRKVFLDYKTGKENETSVLERCIASGKCGLRVAAKCPAVSATGTVSGRTGEGTAELDPTARQDYYAYKRAYDQQFAEYKLCWSELRKRSAKQ